MNEKAKIVIVSAVVSALVAAIVTPVITHILAASFPLSQSVTLIEPKETTHTDKLRDDYPPFVACLVQEDVVRREGLLWGLVPLRPVWRYEIRLANLTSADARNIGVLVHFTRPGEVYLVPRTVGVYDERGDSLPIGESVKATSEDQGASVRATLTKIKSGHAVYFGLAIVAATDPGLEDVTISARSPEGKFSSVTPLQWERIGWETPK
jgi:hypothetical protein